MTRIRQGRPGKYNLGIVTEVEDDGVIRLGGKFKKAKTKRKVMAQDIIDEIL